ncbi:hypothetical protein ACO0SA_000899 [Hanseniaspora valbyensis]
MSTNIIVNNAIPKTLPNIFKNFDSKSDVGKILYENYNHNTFKKQEPTYKNNVIDYKLHYHQNQTVLINNILQKYKTMAISLKQLTKYDDLTNHAKNDSFKEKMLIDSANFIREQLIIRISLKIKDFQNLPYKITSNKHLFKVYKSYYSILENFRKFPKLKTIKDNEKFLSNTQNILSDLNLVNLFNLIIGGLEISNLKYMSKNKLDVWINELLRARISRRLMIEEHISLSQRLSKKANQNEAKQDVNIEILGDMFQPCNIKSYIREITDNLTERMGKDFKLKGKHVPKVLIDGAKDLEIYFLPIHLRFMLNEILRNSFEATLNNGPEGDDNNINITLIKNRTSVILRVSDRGGGISLNVKKPTITSFGKTEETALECLKSLSLIKNVTVKEIIGNTSLQTLQFDSNLTSNINEKLNIQLKKSIDLSENKGISVDDTSFEKPLLNMLTRESRFKLGIGLALCKVYAEYWNGSMELYSLDGYGTDVVLTLGDLVYYGNKLSLDRV